MNKDPITNIVEEKSAIGVDFKMTVKKVTVQAEYANADMTPSSGMDYNIKGYYAQFLYTPNRWTYGYRYDFYDANSSTPNGDKTVDSFIVNYRINSNLILKLEHHLIDNENSATEDYDKTIVSIAANLGG